MSHESVNFFPGELGLVEHTRDPGDYVGQHKTAECQEVFVVELDWYGPEPGDYAGWISVHKTEAGARKRLAQRASQYDLDLDAIDSGEDTSRSTYGISRLKMED